MNPDSVPKPDGQPRFLKVLEELQAQFDKFGWSLELNSILDQTVLLFNKKGYQFDGKMSLTKAQEVLQVLQANDA